MVIGYPFRNSSGGDEAPPLLSQPEVVGDRFGLILGRIVEVDAVLVDRRALARVGVDRRMVGELGDARLDDRAARLLHVAGAMFACLAVRLRERRGAAAPDFLVAMVTSFSVIEARPR
jgi:hypothetical protein